MDQRIKDWRIAARNEWLVAGIVGQASENGGRAELIVAGWEDWGKARGLGSFEWPAWVVGRD